MRAHPLVLVAVTFAAWTVNPLHAAAGHESAAFLNIPVGAGPAALGGAYSALAHDAYAPVWNPAGLGFLERMQLSGQHLSYLESIHYEFASFVRPLRPGKAVGASIQYLGSGNVVGRDLSGNPNGDFSNYYAAYSVSYGQQILPRVSVGLTAKAIQAKLSDVGANAFAADLGLFIRPTQRLSVSGVFSNIGTPLTFLEDKGSLPLTARLGLAWRPVERLTLSSEWVLHKEGEASSGHVGLAWRPMPMVSLRAGYRTDTDHDLGGAAGLSAGLGVDVWGQELSYAWVPYGDLGSTQYFSILFRFGKPEDGRRNLIQFESIKRHRLASSAEHDRYGYDAAATAPDAMEILQLLEETSLKSAANITRAEENR